MEHDVIIIGSGAGGAATAYRLAQNGVSVLLLERGRELPHDGSTIDVDAVMRRAIFKAQEAWFDRIGMPVRPSEYQCLGGKTKWYGAALLRFAPHEFGDDPDHQCLGWPVAYSDLSPFYDEAEILLGVRRFETEPDLAAMVAALQATDPRWFKDQLPVAMAANILEHPEEARHFDGYASVKGLKGDAEVSLLAKVRSRPNLTIRTDCEVVALTPSDNPRKVAGVVCADGSAHRAKTVVLSCGALHSPRLLAGYLQHTDLVRELPWSDSVGRNYKCHLNSALLAVSVRSVTDVLRKTTILTHDRFPHSTVQNTAWLDGEIMSIAGPRYVPRWAYDMLARRAYGFWVTTEDGSHADNRILPRSNGSLGPVIDYDRNRLHPAEREHRALLRTLRRQLALRGYLTVVERMPVSNTAHACGTLIAGRSRARSVVDGEGRVRDFANLYVADGSALTRSSRVNPALTIYAWGLRVASRLQVAA